MKRRLQLMPEVLPAPQVVSTKTATSAVRERTMARLRVLAAVGAGIAAACNGGTTGGSTGDGGGGGSSGGGRDGGLPDGMKPETDAGYGVVNPLPPPACFQYSNPPTATITLGTVDAGPPVDAGHSGKLYTLAVKWPDGEAVATGEIMVISGSTFELVETRPSASGVELVLEETQTSGRNGTITIQTSCTKGPTRVSVSISENGGPEGGLATQVSFYGY